MIFDILQRKLTARDRGNYFMFSQILGQKELIIQQDSYYEALPSFYSIGNKQTNNTNKKPNKDQKGKLAFTELNNSSQAS